MSQSELQMLIWHVIMEAAGSHITETVTFKTCDFFFPPFRLMNDFKDELRVHRENH